MPRNYGKGRKKGCKKIAEEFLKVTNDDDGVIKSIIEKEKAPLEICTAVRIKSKRKFPSIKTTLNNPFSDKYESYDTKNTKKRRMEIKNKANNEDINLHSGFSYRPNTKSLTNLLVKVQTHEKRKFDQIEKVSKLLETELESQDEDDKIEEEAVENDEVKLQNISKKTYERVTKKSKRKKMDRLAQEKFQKERKMISKRNQDLNNISNIVKEIKVQNKQKEEARQRKKQMQLFKKQMKDESHKLKKCDVLLPNEIPTNLRNVKPLYNPFSNLVSESMIKKRPEGEKKKKNKKVFVHYKKN